MSAHTTSTDNGTVRNHDWLGPMPEFDCYGNPTGEMYVECSDCGIEVLAEYTASATHRQGCSL